MNCKKILPENFRISTSEDMHVTTSYKRVCYFQRNTNHSILTCHVLQGGLSNQLQRIVGTNTPVVIIFII